MNIYVGNLSYRMTEDELKNAFAQYGEVTSAKIVKDRDSGQSKGFGFVEMKFDSEAEEAIKQLDDQMVAGRKIKVNMARPRENTRPERQDRY
jgi:RNA recognition motif-containing protein